MISVRSRARRHTNIPLTVVCAHGIRVVSTDKGDIAVAHIAELFRTNSVRVKRVYMGADWTYLAVTIARRRPTL